MCKRVVGIKFKGLLALGNHVVIPARIVKCLRNRRVHEHEQGICVARAFHFAQRFAFTSPGGEKFCVTIRVHRRN